MVGDDRFGPGFDLVFAVSRQTDSGGNLRDLDDLAPVVAEAIYMLGNSPLREGIFAATDNFARRLGATASDGSLTCWSTFGIGALEFDPDTIVRYFANKIGSGVLPRWEKAPADHTALEDVLAAATAAHLGDVDALMSTLYRRGDGRKRLNNFSDEVGKALGKRKVKLNSLPALMKGYADAYLVRIQDAIGEADAAATALIKAFTENVSVIVTRTVDAFGPQTGIRVVEAAVATVDRLRESLSEQRDSLSEKLQIAEGALPPAVKEFEAAATRQRFGFRGGARKELNHYLATASETFAFRYAYNLTDIALIGLSNAREALDLRRAELERLVTSMATASDMCANITRAFENRELTLSEEILARPAYTSADLEQLYGWATGAPWGDTPVRMEASIRLNLGGLSRWLGETPEKIQDDFIAATGPLLKSVAAMDIDSFIRWQRDHRGQDPQLVLRDIRNLAPVLARFDRTRYRLDDTLEDSSLVTLGVPDAETSVFAGTPYVTVVSTGDRRRVSLLQIKIGFPASALLQYPAYEEANARVRNQGRIAHDIYGFHNDAPAKNHGRPSRGRRRR